MPQLLTGRDLRVISAQVLADPLPLLLNLRAPPRLLKGDTSAERRRLSNASGHVLLHKPVSPPGLAS